MPKKAEMEPFVVVLTTASMAGLLALLSGAGILVFQIILWLKDGYWTPVFLGDFLPRGQNWRWKGVEALWNFSLDYDAFFVLGEIALVIIVLTLCVGLIGSHINDKISRLRIEPITKSSPGHAPVESAPEPVNDSPRIRVRGWFAGALPRLAQALYITAALWALWLLRH